MKCAIQIDKYKIKTFFLTNVSQEKHGKCGESSIYVCNTSNIGKK